MFFIFEKSSIEEARGSKAKKQAEHFAHHAVARHAARKIQLLYQFNCFLGRSE